MRRKNIHTLLLLPAAVLMLTAYGFAQDLGYNGRLTGMGNGASALVRGTDALGTNPALITPPNGTNFTFSIIPVGFHAGTDFLDFGTYKKYFTGVEGENGEREPYHLTDADKNSILNTFTDGVGRFAISGNYRLFAATAGWNGYAIGVDVTDRIGSNGAIPQSFVDFMFHGNAPGATYDFSALEFRSSWIRTYGVSFAKQLSIGAIETPVSVGATVKMVHGYGYFGMERFDSQFTTDPDSFVVYGQANVLSHYAGIEWLDNAKIYLIDLFPDPVGSGIGIDIGLHTQLTPFLQVAASITDIGSITWNRNAKKSETNEYFTLNDLSSSEQTEELKEKFNGKETTIGSFQSSLPTALTFSAAYSLPNIFAEGKTLNIAAAIRNGFNNEPGNIEGLFTGIGVEYPVLHGIPLRLGATFGGMQSAAFSAGIGFEIERFTLDIGTGNIISAFGDGFSSSSIAVTTHFDF